MASIKFPLFQDKKNSILEAWKSRDSAGVQGESWAHTLHRSRDRTHMSIFHLESPITELAFDRKTPSMPRLFTVGTPHKVSSVVVFVHDDMPQPPELS